MDSLNFFESGGESDSSSANVSSVRKPVSKKSSVNIEEADANCEPITMDLSEEASSDELVHNDGNPRTELQNFTSKSESPTSSRSSRSSSPSVKKKHRRESDVEPSVHSSSDRLKRKSSKEKHRDVDKDRDDSYDRRHRDEKNRRSSHRTKRDERKRHHSRSKSPEYIKLKSSRYKHRSRSRSRSRDRYRHKRSREHSSRKSSRDHSRDNNRGRTSSRDHSRERSKDRSRGHSREHSHERSSEHGRRRHHSPYRKSKSKSPRDRPKPYDWKSASKLKVLEKLGIPLNIPTTNVPLTQPNLVSTVTAPVVVSTNNGQPLTPQLLLQKTMEEQVEKVKTATGIQLPSYYNPIAVNPSKYAEQMQKRKLLWGNKDKQTQSKVSCNLNIMDNNATTSIESKGTETIWQGAKFGGDQDGRMTAKFQRLMGIKNPTPNEKTTDKKTKEGPDLIKKQEEMFNSMESQYEVARLATHSHRGLGLGFGTFQPR